MPHVEISPEDMAELRATLPQLEAELASAQEDAEAGMDMTQVIDRLERTIRLAKHVLGKYGGGVEVPAVRPRRRAGPR